ncbi:FAD-dependent oxidoreductase [Caulobacter segnis]|uniref:FAD-dependent oxidoreductase n=1 Tax=Caulobacter segnis TaxID=88688 RepID=UPI001CC1798D|nr:FAD-dependent oxidoreductase [Caulobacter segnis]
MRMETLGRRAVLAGLGGFGASSLAGCATGPVSLARPGAARAPILPAVRAELDRITRVTVCLRPFRKAGPRFDVETVGDKTVVHNYGHGGSGWSLSWGSAEQAARKALAGGAREVAVIGCGALGLTTATVLRRAGANVTIYAAERLADTRSSRATGTWSPDSRIAAEGETPAGFPELWETMCRTSFRTFQTYVGLAGSPVEWSDRYSLFDAAPTSGHVRAPGVPHFVEYADRVRDIMPRQVDLPPEANPFPVAHVRRGASLQFNVTEYAHVLMTDFLLAGGKVETRVFNTPGELTGLKEPVIVNCTGYGARALWKDESIVPVRGQIAWLIPQPELRYGLYYKNISVLPRRDGIVFQQVGETEAYGYNDDREVADMDEARTAVSTIAALYARMAARPA